MKIYKRNSYTYLLISALAHEVEKFPFTFEHRSFDQLQNNHLVYQKEDLNVRSKL